MVDGALSSILVTGGLGFVGSNLATHVLKTNPDANVTILDHVDERSDIRRIPQEVRDSKRFSLVIGDLANEKLIEATIKDKKVTAIFNLALSTNIAKSFLDPVANARNNLIGVTHLLDAIRKCPDVKVIVHVSSAQVYNPDGDKTELTYLRPTNPAGASQAGCEAMLHSYAMSYRLNIKIARLTEHVYGPMMHSDGEMSKALGDPGLMHPSATIEPLFVEDACKALVKVVNHQGGVAEIFNVGGDFQLSADEFASVVKQIQSGSLDSALFAKKPDLDCSKINETLGWTPSTSLFDGLKLTLQSNVPAPIVTSPTAKFLVFGGNGWIGQQFTSLLSKQGIPFEVGQSRPGNDLDEKVVEEIVRVAPSHVVSMVGRTHGPGVNSIAYLEGGPDKLKENMRDNFYAPWLLASLCDRMGIHFTYLGTGCLFEFNEKHTFDGPGYTEEDVGNYVGTSYSVVKTYTDRCLRYFKNTLNARIRLPVNYENSPRNLVAKLISFNKLIDIPNSVTILPHCLPILLKMSLDRFTGTFNLVNPGPIRFPQLMEAYKVTTGKALEYEILKAEDHPEMVSTRSHCILDTAKLEEFFPEIPSAMEGIKEALRAIV
ncbi:hypothetical protein L596_008691 [Steinernema carpocapsae]|uniref:NAD-dependent epimerase/dehydratase domain-containing protein n=1 Tax=Steinernema carpocapsae TaxID=34508 RepID=A0A4U5PDJ4_STECR|nr:hypothetical protein L596_008691 [Steinernema carpocapsae]